MACWRGSRHSVLSPNRRHPLRIYSCANWRDDDADLLSHPVSIVSRAGIITNCLMGLHLTPYMHLFPPPRWLRIVTALGITLHYATTARMRGNSIRGRKWEEGKRRFSSSSRCFPVTKNCHCISWWRWWNRKLRHLRKVKRLSRFICNENKGGVPRIESSWWNFFFFSPLSFDRMQILFLTSFSKMAA